MNIKIRKFGMDFKRKWVICMKNFEPYYGEDVKKSVDCRKNGTKRRGGTKMTKQELIKALEVQKGVLEEVKVHIENIEQEIEKLDKE